jgi:predicted transcriptional regulator
MSVKGKVKRLNKQLKELQQDYNNLQGRNTSLNMRLKEKVTSESKNQLYENIIKFAVTNHVGNLNVGMMIDAASVDKMKDLRLLIDRDNECGRAYIIRVTY